MRNITTILFIVFFVLSVFLRLYKISDIPPGVNRDEASIGYTAYSLLHTGKDEYGRVFPLAFESFGDWKLPLYIYLSTVSVAIFGLNEFAVRFPSALAGIGLVIFSFFLTKELTKNAKLALITMGILAIAPWAIHFSRVAEESNVAACLIAAAVLLFLKSYKKNWLIIPSGLLFAFSYFTYAGNYIFTTLLVVGLFLFYRKVIPKTKLTYVGIGIFLVLSILIGSININANHTKISGIGIFGDPTIVHAQIELPRLEHANPNSLVVKFIHNRVIFGIQQFVTHYINAFSPQFLFEVGGTNHAHNIQGIGNGYLIEFVFFLLGFVYLLLNQHKKETQLILWWLLISPIAASITKDAPHSARMFAIFPIFSLVIALGISYLLSLFQKRITKIFLSGVIAILYVISLALYLDIYYVHFSLHEGQSWGFIYRDLNIQLQKPEYKNKNVIISKPEYSPYIFLLFYQKYDPALYQKQAVRYPPTSDGFVHVAQFGRYTFRTVDWGEDLKLANTIIVDDASAIPIELRNQQVSQIYLPNGQSMFGLITTK